LSFTFTESSLRLRHTVSKWSEWSRSRWLCSGRVGL